MGGGAGIILPGQNPRVCITELNIDFAQPTPEKPNLVVPKGLLALTLNIAKQESFL